MLTCRLYRDGVLAEEGFDPARISDELEAPGSLLWVDILDPTPDDLSLLAEEFTLHPLALEDAERGGQRAKVEVFADHVFVVLRPPSGSGFGEVHLFAARGFLVSIRLGEEPDLGPVLKRLERHPPLVAEGGGFLLHAFLDEVVDGYLRLVDDLEDRSDELQEMVFGEVVPEDLQERIFRHRKQAVELRRAVAATRDLVGLLRSERVVITPDLEAYFRDVADHTIRALEFLDNIRELLTTALEAHLSQISNRLNVVMRKLTAWAAIILIPTLIAGIYGMNFRHMPELVWRYGYAWALGLMGLTAGALYLMFRRRGWL